MGSFELRQGTTGTDAMPVTGYKSLRKGGVSTVLTYVAVNSLAGLPLWPHGIQLDLGA